MSTTKKAGVSTVGFVLIILGVIGLGLGGVMIVTTSISAQSRELSALRTEASELDYERAALRTQLESLSSTGSLALRATQLGMVPNPYPAFVSLSDGTIAGDPTPVTGDELPQLRGQLPDIDDVPERTPDDVETPSPVPPVLDDLPADEQENPDDMVAADDPGGE